MSDTSTEQTEPTKPANPPGESEPGVIGFGSEQAATDVITPVPKGELEAKIAAPPRSAARAGTVEHLAARRPFPPLDVNSPEIKQQLAELRTELTALVTDLRWGGATVQDTAESIIPLLNTGPLQQWAPVLVPFILEIDRAGNLVPVWLKVIEREDDVMLPADGNPAETVVGKAKRIAILMLGNYKTPDISDALGRLAGDPNTSLYATQSLVKQGTTAALQALISALKDAEGWAKVDIIEACLALKLSRLYDLVLASGLDRAAGLESYIAVPVYRSIPLERYLRGGADITPRLSQQAALIFAQVIQDSLKASAGPQVLPIVFEQDLHTLATALFEGARRTPNWQYVIALHRLASLLGRYWADISRGAVQDSRIVEPVYACLPMMPDVERWMNGPGRDVLLEVLNGTDEEAFAPVVKALAELRDPRAFSGLVRRVEMTTSLDSREQALALGQVLDALGRLGDRRAVQPILQLVERAINIRERIARPKRRDNLVTGDPDIPGSIVLASALRAFGQLEDRSTLDFVIRVANDFDPYVRTEALEALKRIDRAGEDVRSRIIAREALSDPRDAVARLAMQLIMQYRDRDAIPLLQPLPQARPDLAAAAWDTLRQLG